jgi:hypothetical protein
MSAVGFSGIVDFGWGAAFQIWMQYRFDGGDLFGVMREHCVEAVLLGIKIRHVG